MFEVSIKLPGPGCEPFTGTDGTGVAGDRRTPSSLGVGGSEGWGRPQRDEAPSNEVSISARVYVG